MVIRNITKIYKCLLLGLSVSFMGTISNKSKKYYQTGYLWLLEWLLRNSVTLLCTILVRSVQRSP